MPSVSASPSAAARKASAYSALRAGALAAAGQLDPTEASRTRCCWIPTACRRRSCCSPPPMRACPTCRSTTASPSAELEQLLQRVAPAWLVSQPTSTRAPRACRRASIASMAPRSLGAAAPPASHGAASRRVIRVRWPCSCSPAAPPEPPRRRCCGMKTSCPTFSAPWSSRQRRRRRRRSWRCRRTTSPGISAVLSSTYSGRRIVMLPSFEPAEWLRRWRRRADHPRLRRADHAGAHHGATSRIAAGRPRFPALRAIAYGGGKMPLAVIERALRGISGRRLHQRLRAHRDQRHGVPAEPRGSPARRRERRAARCAGGLRPVGKPLPIIELQVRDAAGTVLEPAAVRRGVRARRAGRGRVPRRGQSARCRAAGSRPRTAAGSMPKGYRVPRGARRRRHRARRGEHLARARSRRCCSRTRPWPMPWWLRCRASSGARRSAPRSWC